jgi:hypothetical protein
MKSTGFIPSAHQSGGFHRRSGQRQVQSKGVGIVDRNEVGFVLALRDSGAEKRKLFRVFIFLTGRCKHGSLLHNIISI